MIAALFVDPRGVYAGLPDVEVWDEARDARKYAGPWPVVAHPPCQLWVNLAGVNFKRYGGAHNRPGNDGGCFSAALESVWTWGGVLEHPANSFAWDTFRLPRPDPERGWTFWPAPLSRFGCCWVCEAWQSAYGHRARKRTWLYYSGPRSPTDLDWRRAPGVAQVGWFDRAKPTVGKREANATPPAFRDALLSLAHGVGQERAA